jgi:hypothetical protein
MKTFIRIIIATILAITIVGHVPASAVTISFTENGETVDATVSDFTGTVTKTRPAAESVQVVFTVSNGELATVNNALAFLLEPISQNDKTSDIVRLTVAAAGGQNRTITATFASDSEDNLRQIPANAFTMSLFAREMESAVTLSGDANTTKFFTQSGTQINRYVFPGNLTITAQSEPLTPVPEPSTISMVGLVVIGLALHALLRWKTHARAIPY